MQRSCPICKARFEADEKEGFFPFCSRRCQLVDLGNWLGERYVVPVGRGGTAFADEDLPDDGSGGDLH